MGASAIRCRRYGRLLYAPAMFAGIRGQGTAPAIAEGVSMKFASFLASATLLCAGAVGWSAPVITVGDHNLLPDTAGQQIHISVSGGQAVRGFNLFVMSGDGGELLGGVNGSAPAITDVSISIGTIFAPHIQTVTDGEPQFWSAWIDTDGADVPASGVVAILTIDTSGFEQGTYPLLLGGFDPSLALLDTTFSDASPGGELAAVIFNGTITVVPEPASLAVFALGGALLLRRRSAAQ
jgi:hypothetical protein